MACSLVKKEKVKTKIKGKREFEEINKREMSY